MPLLSWQLWLAHTGVSDCPLPWQKPASELSPGGVANSFAQVLARIGTPAVAPKPRGKSPGWTPGRLRQRRIRCPVVKKVSPSLEVPQNSLLDSYSSINTSVWLDSLALSSNFAVSLKSSRYDRWNKGHHILGRIIAECGVAAYIDWVEVPEWLLNRTENAVVSYQPKLNSRTPSVV